MQRIDPATEEPTRKILGHTLRVEESELARVLDRVADAGLLPQVTRLTAQVATVVCIDLSEQQTPTPEKLSEIAHTTAQIDVDYSLTTDQVYDYLARVVFGAEPLNTVFGAEDAIFLPFAITSNLLASTAGLVDGRDWLAYLDAVETAIEKAPEPG